ncbi:hypothetical protein D3C75_629270 [compost metagenome]
MAGLGNRQVEARIGRALLRPGHFVGPGIAVLQRIERRLQPRAVRLGRALGRVVGAGRLQGMAEFEQVTLRLGTVLEQLQQRVAESGPQGLGDKIAPTLAADQQPLGHQLLDRLTQ